MVDLNLNRINLISPYTVWKQGGQYLFKTDNLIIYSVTFDEEEMLSDYSAYWLNLSNASGQKSPNDKKISLTIAAIIREFFYSQPRIILYLCDSANNQQSQRARLFLYWFEKLNKEKKFFIKTAIVKDEEEENYIALIAENGNPLLKEVLAVFSNEVNFLNKGK